MSDVVDKIKKELDEFNAKKVKLVEELRTEFPNILKPLFEKSKLIESIGWTQYTPYFNDGNSCEFGVNEVSFINGEDLYDIEWYDWRVQYEKYHAELTKEGNTNFEECKIIEEFKSLLDTIPNDFYEDLFGDHVQVTIHKDGRIDVEEYDHD